MCYWIYGQLAAPTTAVASVMNVERRVIAGTTVDGQNPA